MAYAARGAGPWRPLPRSGMDPRVKPEDDEAQRSRQSPSPPRCTRHLSPSNGGEERHPPRQHPSLSPAREIGAASPPPPPLPPRSGERWPAKRVGEGVGRDSSRLPQRRHPRASEAKRSATLGSMPEWHMPRGARANPSLAISDVWPSLRSSKPSKLLSPPQGGG